MRRAKCHFHRTCLTAFAFRVNQNSPPPIYPPSSRPSFRNSGTTTFLRLYIYMRVFLTGDYSGLKGERVSNSVRRESGWKDWERGLDDERPSRILFFVGRRDRSRIFHRGLFARETRAAAAAAVDLQNAIDWRLGLHR